MINKRRSRNDKGELVLKKHFEHPKIDVKLVKQVFDEEVVPWCKENGLKRLIMDNESKFHTKMLVTRRDRPIETTRKIVDRQPKIMRAIIETNGGRTPY